MLYISAMNDIQKKWRQFNWVFFGTPILLISSWILFFMVSPFFSDEFTDTFSRILFYVNGFLFIIYIAYIAGTSFFFSRSYLSQFFTLVLFIIFFPLAWVYMLNLRNKALKT